MLAATLARSVLNSLGDLSRLTQMKRLLLPFITVCLFPCFLALSEESANRPSVADLEISWEPKSNYGSLEDSIRKIRDARPLDLNAETWRAAHPEGRYEEWQKLAVDCLRKGLHYDPGNVDLDARILRQEETDDLIRELVEFNTTPWFRIRAYFIRPKKASQPLPALLVLHGWGGPMVFGKERLVDSGRDHPALRAHREKYFEGAYLAEEMAKAGYAVLTTDHYHFGVRCPRGLFGVPAEFDPFALSEERYQDIERKLRDLVYLGVRQLNWAGTTWGGVNFGDDSRSIDYLLSRPEVDPGRIGCTGLSGGGWRTNMLVALEPRIKAGVSVGWMTTGDHQQIYNVRGAVGTFNLLPGVWNRIDIPDLVSMAAPRPVMVVVGTEDRMVPLEGVEEANRQMRAAYQWAGVPDSFRAFNPAKGHCYDEEIRREAIDWLDRHLK